MFTLTTLLFEHRELFTISCITFAISSFATFSIRKVNEWQVCTRGSLNELKRGTVCVEAKKVENQIS